MIYEMKLKKLILLDNNYNCEILGYDLRGKKRAL
jgi:hypothetical protein